MTDASRSPALSADISTSYQTTVSVKAAVDDVFNALTTARAITAWWNEASGSGEAGGDLTLPMGPPEPLVIHVEQAVRPETVQWLITDCPFLEDWVGTRPTFTITRLDDATSEVHFRHVGLTQELECIDLCAPSWDHFVSRSLRDYLELGTGHPRHSEADEAWRRELGM